MAVVYCRAWNPNMPKDFVGEAKMAYNKRRSTEVYKSMMKWFNSVLVDFACYRVFALQEEYEDIKIFQQEDVKGALDMLVACAESKIRQHEEYCKDTDDLQFYADYCDGASEYLTNVFGEFYESLLTIYNNLHKRAYRVSAYTTALLKLYDFCQLAQELSVQKIKSSFYVKSLSCREDYEDVTSEDFLVGSLVKKLNNNVPKEAFEEIEKATNKFYIEIGLQYVAKNALDYTEKYDKERTKEIRQLINKTFKTDVS